MYIGNRIRRRRCGFTLIEAIASVAILSIGIVAVMGGIGAMSRAESRIRQIEAMTILAQHKYDELIATTANLTTNQTGDFTDQNNNDYSWSATIDQTGVTNLVAVSVTVNPTVDTSSSAPVAHVSGLIYQAPASTTGATP